MDYVGLSADCARRLRGLVITRCNCQACESAGVVELEGVVEVYQSAGERSFESAPDRGSSSDSIARRAHRRCGVRVLTCVSAQPCPDVGHSDVVVTIVRDMGPRGSVDDPGRFPNRS